MLPTVTHFSSRRLLPWVDAGALDGQLPPVRVDRNGPVGICAVAHVDSVGVGLVDPASIDGPARRWSQPKVAAISSHSPACPRTTIAS